AVTSSPPVATSGCSGRWATRARAGRCSGSRKLFDTKEGELVDFAAHGEANAVPGLDGGAVEQRGIGKDSHQLHGSHAQGGHGFVLDDDEVRGGTRDDRAADFVGGRA